MTTEVVLAPDVDAAAGDRLVQALQRGVPDQPSRSALVTSICFLILGSVTAANIALAVDLTTIIFLLGITVAAFTISATAFTSWVRERRDWQLGHEWAAELERARRSGQLIVVGTDFDRPAQDLFRRVQGDVRSVAASRAHRQGLLEGGLVLLQDQQWRIATALVRLSEARALLARTGARLAEHRDAVHAAEQIVEQRVRAVLAYAESVRHVDDTLADIDAASHTATLDHKLRDTLAALGEEQSLDSLTAETRKAQAAVDEALRGLRAQTDALRSIGEDHG